MELYCTAPTMAAICCYFQRNPSSRARKIKWCHISKCFTLYIFLTQKFLTFTVYFGLAGREAEGVRLPVSSICEIIIHLCDDSYSKRRKFDDTSFGRWYFLIDTFLILHFYWTTFSSIPQLLIICKKELKAMMSPEVYENYVLFFLCNNHDTITWI